MKCVFPLVAYVVLSSSIIFLNIQKKTHDKVFFFLFRCFPDFRGRVHNMVAYPSLTW